MSTAPVANSLEPSMIQPPSSWSYRLLIYLPSSLLLTVAIGLLRASFYGSDYRIVIQTLLSSIFKQVLDCRKNEPLLRQVKEGDEDCRGTEKDQYRNHRWLVAAHCSQIRVRSADRHHTSTQGVQKPEHHVSSLGFSLRLARVRFNRSRCHVAPP